MNTPGPILSILIPTKNRYATLLPVVSSILDLIADVDMEIVVQDNSEDNAVAAPFFAHHTDPRLRYFHRSDSVSIVQNTIDAIDNSHGRFLCFIGDDDIVAPQIVAETRRLEQSGLKCLIHAPAYYWWPSVEFIKPDHYRQKTALWLPKARDDAQFTTLDSADQLAHMLANGAVSYYQLPRLYHGIVHREVLDEIKARCGSYVPGASPDMALSVAIALTVESYLHTARPLTVFGASKGSGGGRTASQQHHGRLEDQKHLPASTVRGWDHRLPRYWSEYTIYPQTVVEVYRAFKLPLDLDFVALYASMLVNESWLGRRALPLVARICGLSIGRWARFTWVLARRAAGRAHRALIAGLGTRPVDLVLCPDIKTCMSALSQ